MPKKALNAPSAAPKALLSPSTGSKTGLSPAELLGAPSLEAQTPDASTPIDSGPPTRKRSIAIAGSRGIPARYGGFETTADVLARRLVDAGHRVIVSCETGPELRYDPAPPLGPASTIIHDSLACAKRSTSSTCSATARPSPQLFRVMAGAEIWINPDGVGWARAKWPPLADSYGLKADQYFLIVCRLEPENHIFEAIEGYKAGGDLGMPLAILGSTEKKIPYVKQPLEAAEGTNVRFIGTECNPEKLAALTYHAPAYVHGHSLGRRNQPVAA